MKKTFFYLPLVLTLLFSCSEEEIEPNGNGHKEHTVSPDSNKDLLSKLISQGFQKEDIVEYNDYFLVEDDIIIEKEDLQSNNGDKQARWQYLVTDSHRTIYVYLNTNFPSLNSQMSSALNSVVNAFNISGSSLNFIRTYNPNQADITITNDNNIGASVCGRGGFPYSYGAPYGTVQISENTLTSSGSTSFSKLVFLLVHELGHNIGLRHTNWQQNGEPTGIQIGGTPHNDPLSVMNANTCGNDWTFFSDEDLIALNHIYPQISYMQLGGVSWQVGVKAMTSLNGWVYLIENSRLYKVNPNNGSYTQLGGVSWQAGVKAMTSLNGWLYLIENSRLYRVSPTDGSYTQLGGVSWQAGVKAMTSLNGWLYLIENSRLYRVSPTNGSYTQLGGVSWQAGVKAMTSLNGWLYLIENNRLYKVDPSNGSYVQLGAAVWDTNVEGITALNGLLYIVENKRIYEVNPSNGSYELITAPIWGDTDAITSLSNKLYLVENSRFYSVSRLN